MGHLDAARYETVGQQRQVISNGLGILVSDHIRSIGPFRSEPKFQGATYADQQFSPHLFNAIHAVHVEEPVAFTIE